MQIYTKCSLSFFHKAGAQSVAINIRFTLKQIEITFKISFVLNIQKKMSLHSN